MDEQIEYGFTTGMFVLDHTARKVSAEDAERSFNDVTKENFWRMWPEVRDWAEELWKRIDEDRGHAAMPFEDNDLDETGGSG